MEFKHDAINEISVIYGYCHLLRRKALSDIKAEMAVEVRDLCADLIYKIDRFEKTNVPLRRFIEGAV